MVNNQNCFSHVCRQGVDYTPVGPYWQAADIRGNLPSALTLQRLTGLKKRTKITFWTYLKLTLKLKRNVIVITPTSTKLSPPLASRLLNSSNRSADCKHTARFRQGWKPLGVGGFLSAELKLYWPLHIPWTFKPVSKLLFPHDWSLVGRNDRSLVCRRDRSMGSRHDRSLVCRHDWSLGFRDVLHPTRIFINNPRWDKLGEKRVSFQTKVTKTGFLGTK